MASTLPRSFEQARRLVFGYLPLICGLLVLRGHYFLRYPSVFELFSWDDRHWWTVQHDIRNGLLNRNEFLHSRIEGRFPSDIWLLTFVVRIADRFALDLLSLNLVLT